MHGELDDRRDYALMRSPTRVSGESARPPAEGPCRPWQGRLGGSSHVCGNQLLDFRASKSVLGLATSLSGLPSGLRVEVCPALKISNSLVTDLNEVDRGV